MNNENIGCWAVANEAHENITFNPELLCDSDIHTVDDGTTKSPKPLAWNAAQREISFLRNKLEALENRLAMHAEANSECTNCMETRHIKYREVSGKRIDLCEECLHFLREEYLGSVSDVGSPFRFIKEEVQQ